MNCCVQLTGTHVGSYGNKMDYLKLFMSRGMFIHLAVKIFLIFIIVEWQFWILH